MISSLIGSLIMSAVSVALLMAIDVTDKALLEVGKYPLTMQERQLLIDAGYDELIYIDDLNEDIKNLEFNE